MTPGGRRTLAQKPVSAARGYDRITVVTKKVVIEALFENVYAVRPNNPVETEGVTSASRPLNRLIEDTRKCWLDSFELTIATALSTGLFESKQTFRPRCGVGLP